MDFYTITNAANILLASAVALWLYCWFTQSQYRLPPGPQGSLFYGVKNSLPRTEPWKTYASWSKTFNSPVISFRVYNRTIIVLNDLKAISTLLDQRSNIYSERPMSWMYNVICGRGKSVFNISASDPRQKTYRRMLQSGLGQTATKQAWDVMTKETMILLEGFANRPEEWTQHIRRNASAVIMKVAFGYTINSLEDPFIKVAEETSKISGWATAPGRWLVDYYPILRYVPAFLPGAEWKRQGLAWKERLSYLSEVPHNWVKEQMLQGVHVDSFTSRFLSPDSFGDDMISRSKRKLTLVGDDEEDIIKWCASGLYAGAADTTVSALISFVLLMALHPEVQRKVQTELDSTFELNNLTFADEPVVSEIEQLGRLAYLGAVLNEVLRYAPVGNLVIDEIPTALPHSNLEDDTYEGYHIPKGSTVMGNVWALMHNAEIYPDPFTFNPERFMTTDNNEAPQPDPRTFAFGFGRRACPGSYFAETTMLLAMASILARFEFSLPASEENKVIQNQRASCEFTTGITSHIKPFPIQITERHVRKDR